jgi:hypothetical protein
MWRQRAGIFDERLDGLTDLLISCARPRAPRSDAARPLPRLTMRSEEANCNGRDAVATKVTEERQLRSI